MPESIIARYYERLAANELLAGKCKGCGAYTFPPTTSCERCGSFDLDYVTLSGRGTLMYASHGMAPPPNPRFEELAPFTYGHILLEEGIPVQAIVAGVSPEPDVLLKLYERGPVPVRPQVLKVKGLDVLAFRLD